VSSNEHQESPTDARIADLERELARLRRHNEELTDFVENGAIGLHWVGPDGTILWANQAELDMLGYQKPEYIGHHIAEFHADPPIIQDILQRLQARETLRNYEARLLAKDGSIRHVVINSNVVWDGDCFIHTRCFTWDITDRRRAEEELRRAYDSIKVLADEARSREEILRMALLDSPVVVFHQDSDLRYKWVYNSFVEHRGKSLLNRLDSELFPPEEAEPLDRLKRGVLSSGKSARQEIVLTTQGMRRTMDVRIEPFLDASGRMAGVLGTAVDITERKRNEQQLSRYLERLRRLGARLRTLQEREREITSREIHDLGQALTALDYEFNVLAARVLSTGTDPSMLAERLKTASGLLASTIESSARISTNLRPSLLDNMGLAHTLEWHAREFARRTGIRVIPGALKDVRLDPEVQLAVFRIFQEVLTNVERHASATEVQVTMSLEAGGVILRIVDNGTGIGDQVADPKSLGLLAIREMALLFGAGIEILGIPGIGTTVVLRIPLDAHVDMAGAG
jgi:PAS domain S-box-containing protein